MVGKVQLRTVLPPRAKEVLKLLETAGAKIEVLNRKCTLIVPGREPEGVSGGTFDRLRAAQALKREVGGWVLAQPGEVDRLYNEKLAGIVKKLGSGISLTFKNINDGYEWGDGSGYVLCCDMTRLEMRKMVKVTGSNVLLTSPEAEEKKAEARRQETADRVQKTLDRWKDRLAGAFNAQHYDAAKIDVILMEIVGEVGGKEILEMPTTS